jgi:hypothetical protein
MLFPLVVNRCELRHGPHRVRMFFSQRPPAYLEHPRRNPLGKIELLRFEIGLAKTLQDRHRVSMFRPQDAARCCFCRLEHGNGLFLFSLQPIGLGQRSQALDGIRIVLPEEPSTHRE